MFPYKRLRIYFVFKPKLISPSTYEWSRSWSIITNIPVDTRCTMNILWKSWISYESLMNIQFTPCVHYYTLKKHDKKWMRIAKYTFFVNSWTTTIALCGRSFPQKINNVNALKYLVEFPWKHRGVKLFNDLKRTPTRTFFDTFYSDTLKFVHKENLSEHIKGAISEMVSRLQKQHQRGSL